MNTRRCFLLTYLTIFWVTLHAQTPFIDEIENLLDKPFFEMMHEFDNNDLAPEIRRHIMIPQADGGFSDKDRIIAITALAEYYIGLRKIPEARQFLSLIDYHSKIFQNIKKIHQARFHQALGFSLGYRTSHIQDTPNSIKKGLEHYAIAEVIYKNEPSQTEELFRLHFNKARHYLWLGDKPHATSEINLAESLLPFVKQDGYKSAFYYIKGNIHLANNEYAQATQHYEKSRFFMNDLFKSEHLPESIDEKLANIHARHA